MTPLHGSVGSFFWCSCWTRSLSSASQNEWLSAPYRKQRYPYSMQSAASCQSSISTEDVASNNEILLISRISHKSVGKSKDTSAGEQTRSIPKKKRTTKNKKKSRKQADDEQNGSEADDRNDSKADDDPPVSYCGLPLPDNMESMTQTQPMHSSLPASNAECCEGWPTKQQQHPTLPAPCRESHWHATLEDQLVTLSMHADSKHAEGLGPNGHKRAGSIPRCSKLRLQHDVGLFRRLR